MLIAFMSIEVTRNKWFSLFQVDLEAAHINGTLSADELPVAINLCS